MSGLDVGIVFETYETYPLRSGEPADAHAEYEPEETVAVLEAALASLGHRPLRLGSPLALLEQIGRGTLPRLDCALNIAEGFGSRNREAWAPNLLEMAGVPTLGSDAATLTLTLDKAWAHRSLACSRVAVPPHAVVPSGARASTLALPADFPLFVKPRWEGTAKGIRRSSRVADRASLVAEVERICADYDQPALVEAFLPGAEYTVTVVGNDPPRVLPVLQRALETESRIGLHALTGESGAGGLAYCTPGELTRELERELERLAERVYRVFECRDFARVDFRLDGRGEPVFLEINPLPTFAPDGSFGILAELAQRPVEALIAEVLDLGLARLGLSKGPEGWAPKS